MLFSKTNLAIAELVDKFSFGATGSVFFTKDKTVATNRRTLLEISSIQPEGEQITGAMRGYEPFLINAKELKTISFGKEFPYIGVKHLDRKQVVMVDRAGQEFKLGRQDDKFPDYEYLIKNSGKGEMVLDAELLMPLLKIMGKLDNKIKIKFGTDTEPVVLSCSGNGQTAKALIMPIKE